MPAWQGRAAGRAAAAVTVTGGTVTVLERRGDGAAAGAAIRGSSGAAAAPPSQWRYPVFVAAGGAAPIRVASVIRVILSLSLTRRS